MVVGDFRPNFDGSIPISVIGLHFNDFEIYSVGRTVEGNALKAGASVSKSQMKKIVQY